MKHLIFLLFAAFTFSAFGQSGSSVEKLLNSMANHEEPHLPVNETRQHVGQDVYIFEEIKGFKIVNDTLTYLYLGGKFPSHALLIIIQGRQANQDLSQLRTGKKSRFSGKVFLYEGRPALIIKDALQTGKQIQI